MTWRRHQIYDFRGCYPASHCPGAGGHEDDNYYLGTPYAGGDAQSPNGDTSYNSGAAGMNCAGFISYVLRKAGLDAETTMEIMHRTPVNQYGSGLPYDWLAGRIQLQKPHRKRQYQRLRLPHQAGASEFRLGGKR